MRTIPDPILLRRSILPLVLLLSLPQSAAAVDLPGTVAAGNLLPQPVAMAAREGCFRIEAGTAVVAPPELNQEARTLAADLRKLTGAALPVREQGDGPAVRLEIDRGMAGLPSGSYRLRVGNHGVVISAPAPAGVFHGGRSLLQLVPAVAGKDEVVIAGVSIDDHPRFAWRGLMLDCSRTFQSVDYIKATIDRMAAFKMNVLHLHLTDDQGWRIEIRRHPELTKRGAKFSPEYNEPPAREGFYTREEMKGIVAHAAARHITVVPEIEMPGHSHAVMVCRPDLSCSGKTTLGVFPFNKGPTITSDVFCAGNEDVFRFLEEVLDEVIDVFPSRFIHVGGDEAPLTAWRACPKCQARMKAEGLPDERALAGYFMRRVERHLAAKGRRLVGWDEILEGGLAPNAIVMSWRGTSGGIAAASAGHDVVMSPTSHCYFDYDHDAISSRRVFSFDPVAGMDPAGVRHVLGIQANFWSHIDREPWLVDRQLFPRLMALAERGWSPDNRADWTGYAVRARAQLDRLDAMGVRYHHGDLPDTAESADP